MAGATARPVSIGQIQKVRLQLIQAAKRIEDALEIMVESNIDEIEVRAHVAMTKGVQAIVGMSTDIKNKADDKALSLALGIPTKVEVNREKHAAYDKPKPAAKKKAKAPGKRTEGA